VVNDFSGSNRDPASLNPADDVERQIDAFGGEALVHDGDVGDSNVVGDLFAATLERFGRMDILVNNAGILRDKPIWEQTDEDFDDVMRVHARGTWLCCRAAAKHWRAIHAEDGRPTGGRIVNTTSGTAMFGLFGQANYGAAKGAVLGLTATLALELAPYGVTVNALRPHGHTRMGAAVLGTQVFDDSKAGGEYDVRDPSLCSPLVAWLASDEAAYITGQVFRTVADRIVLMRGWYEDRAICSGGRRWMVEEVGERIATDVFRCAPPGQRFRDINY
jgi:NAD(P)-dependent dehydrogenase (short-subunit alcohol dehydrogenase family)